MKSTLVGAIVLAGACLSVACAPKKQTVSLQSSAASYSPADYRPVLKRWTRSLRLNTLAEMDNVLTVTSTYYSSDFRAAYVARYADDYELSPAQRDQLAQEQKQLSQTQHEFYVALYAQYPEYGELKEDTAAWVVELVDDRGHVTKPIEMSEIRRPNVNDVTYFPYTSPYRKVFRIVFAQQADGAAAIDPQAEWFGLRFLGPQGKAVLKWELQ